MLSTAPSTPASSTTPKDASPAAPVTTSTEVSSPSHYELIPPLSLKAFPPRIIDVEYAVRGKVLLRSKEVAKRLDEKPFDKLLMCHIGNPLSVGNKPLSYIREMLSLIVNPSLLENPQVHQLFKSDTIERAQRYLGYLKDAGAYTDSMGALGFRTEIASWLEKRDGVRPREECLLLSNGASDAIGTILQLLIGGSEDAVMLPMPQYALYSATVTKLGGKIVYYELEEEDGWNIKIESVERSYEDALKNGYKIKAIVCINPGNPSSTLLLDHQKIQILKFCQTHNLLLIADEVYQENIYNSTPFNSFRKLLYQHVQNCSQTCSQSCSQTCSQTCSQSCSQNCSQSCSPDTVSKDNLTTPSNPSPTSNLDFPTYRPVQLVSLHSASKGFYGECGFRGGLCCLDNVDSDALAIIYKMRSVELCSNTIGQAVITAIVTPPTPGQPSYEQWQAEKAERLRQFSLKATMVVDFFNSLTGVSCQPVKAALYAFPSIQFSNKAIQAAREAGESIEAFYCLSLLEETGIVSTPGDGFGQKTGTHHLRMTILPELTDLEAALTRFRAFHEKFMATYQ